MERRPQDRLAKEREAGGLAVTWSETPWQRALVYGLGASGRAASALLRSRGVEVVAVDSREREALGVEALLADPGFTLLPGGEEATLPEGIDGLVVSPGVPFTRPLLVAARRRGLPVIAEVELAFQVLDGMVVGITGSNGKSTTTAMTGALLRQAGLAVEVCGNIGLPLSACVDGPPDRVFVVELSSFQLEGIRAFRPRAAALLNISADHLDRHGDLQGYRQAKMTIFQSQDTGDISVLNAADPLVSSAQPRSRRRFFSREAEVKDGCFLRGDKVVEAIPGKPERILFQASDVPIPGLHNLENAMAAALLALAMGVPAETLASGLSSFRGLPHRAEMVRERGGVRWIDDSKGTNVGATASCLAGFGDGEVNLILGGRAKGQDFAPLLPLVQRKARRVYLLGEAEEELARVLLPAAEQGVALRRVGTLGRAVTLAARQAEAGEIVLLSPACSSFDQFDNFAARGCVFQELVRQLPAPGDPKGGRNG